MPSAFAPFQAAAIRAELTTSSLSLLRQLTLLQAVDSTNQALRRLPADQQHGHVIVADRQSAGRGRRGRSWYSPAGQNIYLSLAWSFHRASRELQQLPLAVAVAVARAVQLAGIDTAGIKWPNDIQVHGKKLAGILVELTTARPDQALAVIGIGVNVCMPADHEKGLPIDQAWTDICTHTTLLADQNFRDRVCGLLLNELLSAVDLFATKAFTPFADDWHKWDVLRGREVMASLEGKTTMGTAMGITSSGGLSIAIKADSGKIQQREFFSGDVTIRCV